MGIGRFKYNAHIVADIPAVNTTTRSPSIAQRSRLR